MRTATDYAREAASLEAQLAHLQDTLETKEAELSALRIAGRDCLSRCTRLERELREARAELAAKDGRPYDYAA